tara:strand:- start:969 stop:2021 length:1053 start_codon:yes stop_codon:yes gene_type:complete
MNDYEINDKRTIQEFKGISFSNYKKSKVKKELITSLYKSQIEASNYWAAELICSGHILDLWDIIIIYTGRYIHIGNPKLSIYLDMRLDNFKNLIDKYNNNELQIRNNIKFRHLFAEVISVLCLSKKKYAFENLNIKDKNDYNILNLTEKLKAPNTEYAYLSFKNYDPKELFIAINEFNYHISKDSNDCINATYWLEWILQYETICKSQKFEFKCETRDFVNVLDRYSNDIVWIIWESLLKESERDKIINKIMLSLLNLFSIKYTNSCKKKRKYLMYSAIYFLTEKINFNINVIQNKNIIENICSKINLIYKQIKENEIKPDDNYLFNGLEKSNFDKSIDKLEMMDKFLLS